MSDKYSVPHDDTDYKLNIFSKSFALPQLQIKYLITSYLIANIQIFVNPVNPAVGV
jgi:hypothetical protein